MSQTNLVLKFFFCCQLFIAFMASCSFWIFLGCALAEVFITDFYVMFQHLEILNINCEDLTVSNAPNPVLAWEVVHKHIHKMFSLTLQEILWSSPLSQKKSFTLPLCPSPRGPLSCYAQKGKSRCLVFHALLFQLHWAPTQLCRDVTPQPIWSTANSPVEPVVSTLYRWIHHRNPTKHLECI